VKKKQCKRKNDEAENKEYDYIMLYKLLIFNYINILLNRNIIFQIILTILFFILIIIKKKLIQLLINLIMIMKLETLL